MLKNYYLREVDIFKIVQSFVHMIYIQAVENRLKNSISTKVIETILNFFQKSAKSQFLQKKSMVLEIAFGSKFFFLQKIFELLFL